MLRTLRTRDVGMKMMLVWQPSGVRDCLDQRVDAVTTKCRLFEECSRLRNGANIETREVYALQVIEHAAIAAVLELLLDVVEVIEIAHLIRRDVQREESSGGWPDRNS